MTYDSFLFFCFLAIIIVLYYMFPLKKRWIILLAASLVFYGYSSINAFAYVLVSAGVTYCAGLFISRNSISDKFDNSNQKEKKRKTILCVAIAIVIGLLAYTKIIRVCGERVNEIIIAGQPISLNIIIPLGISYYTFSSIGYLLDIYWKRYDAEQNFLKFLLYLLYFPHILQGPIPRYNKLAPQLFEGHKFCYKDFCFGLQLMLWGLFKKLVIADRLAVFVNTVYGGYSDIQGIVFAVATVFYAIQLYADFSGCMDIARGVSQIFGIEIDNNFKQPYFAQSVEEYWRRWHITLGTWFKDYLCMPIAVSKHVKKMSAKIGKRHGSKARKNYVLIVSSMAVWLATGLWHGTGMNYVLWGIWNGSIIVISAIMSEQYKRIKNVLRIDDSTKEWRNIRILRTFVLAGFIPRVLTRASNVTEAMTIFKKMFSVFDYWTLYDSSLYNYGLDRSDFWVAMCSMIVLLIVSVMKEKGIQIRESIANRSIIYRWGMYYGIIVVILVFGIYGPGYDANSFIYMNF